jgi:hypothetical protein
MVFVAQESDGPVVRAIDRIWQRIRAADSRVPAVVVLDHGRAASGELEPALASSIECQTRDIEGRSLRLLSAACGSLV